MGNCKSKPAHPKPKPIHSDIEHSKERKIIRDARREAYIIKVRNSMGGIKITL